MEAEYSVNVHTFLVCCLPMIARDLNDTLMAVTDNTAFSLLLFKRSNFNTCILLLKDIFLLNKDANRLVPVDEK